MIRSLVASVVAGLFVLGAVPTQSALASQQQITQGIIYGTYGCANEIRIQGFDISGSPLDRRTIVRSTGNVQLIPYDASQNPNVFLYGAFDCEAKSYRLYSQALGIRPEAQLIAAYGPEVLLLGATWDKARNAPVVLLRAGGVHSIQMLRDGRWDELWSRHWRDLGDYFLNGIQSRTGREFLLWGNTLGPSWQTWRLDASGFLARELSGPGRIQEVASTPSGNANAIVGEDASWVCDSRSFGPVSDAIVQGRCATVPGGAGGSGAFLSAGAGWDEIYWLNLAPAPLGAPTRSRVNCVGGTMFLCGSPVVSDVSRTSLVGLGYVARPLFDIKRFTRLGSTQAP